jgi:hypothetical protein
MRLSLVFVIGLEAALLLAVGYQGSSTYGTEPPVSKGGRSMPSVHAPGSNLITNPSFATDLSGWSPYAGSSRLVVSRRAHRVGGTSADVTAVGTKQFGIIQYDVVSRPRAGSRYALSAWVRARPDRTVLVQLTEDRLRGWRIAARTTSVASGRWQHLATTGSVVDEADVSLTVSILETGSITRGDSIYIDGVDLHALG